jgi:ribosome biogenesis GTPase A
MGFCRIPLSSCHPQIPVWCLNKPRLLIMNRADMVSQQDQQEWSNYYGSQGLSVFNTDANNGKGITKVTHCMCERCTQHTACCVHLSLAICVYLANLSVQAVTC